MKTLLKRIPTNTAGVFYKEIISKNNKVVDKIFLIRYTDANNKQRLKTIGKKSDGITEAYCKAKLSEITTRIKLGEDLPHIAKRKSKLTFDDLAKKYFEDKICTTKEAKKEQARYINHIQKDIGHILPENISSDQLLKMQTAFTKKFSPRTTNHLIFLIGTIFKYANKKEIYKGTSPTVTLDGLKVDNRRENYLELSEINELLQVTREVSLELWLFVKISLSTGGRIGTVTELKKKDINLNTNTITLKDFKNTRTYKGYISDDELKNILQERLKSLKANDYVLLKKRYWIETKLRPILDELFNKELDLDDRKNRIVIHSLRGTVQNSVSIG